MPDRFTILRATATATLALLALAAPAGAAAVAVPADAPVVAGPTEHGGRMQAWLAGGKLCLKVTQPAPQPGEWEPSVPGADEPSCDRIPILSAFGDGGSPASGTVVSGS